MLFVSFPVRLVWRQFVQAIDASHVKNKDQVQSGKFERRFDLKSVGFILVLACHHCFGIVATLLATLVWNDDEDELI